MQEYFDFQNFFLIAGIITGLLTLTPIIQLQTTT